MFLFQGKYAVNQTSSKTASEMKTHLYAFKGRSLQAKTIYFGLNLHNNKSLSTMTAP